MTTETVSVPKAHEGIGAALRAAYLPRVSDMPADIAALLDKLH
ncbi:MAG: hypothetical protein ABW173_02340 [Sphingomonas sp.]